MEVDIGLEGNLDRDPLDTRAGAEVVQQPLPGVCIAAVPADFFSFGVIIEKQ